MMITAIKKKIQDWRVGAGVEVDKPKDLKEYDLEVNIDGGQLYIDITDEQDEGGDALSIIIEINEGKPCIHIGTEVGGDNILHAFSVDGSLVVTPESGVKTSSAEISRYTYNQDNSILFR